MNYPLSKAFSDPDLLIWPMDMHERARRVPTSTAWATESGPGAPNVAYNAHAAELVSFRDK